MELTPAERLTTLLICDLYREPDDRQFDPEIIEEAIFGGHEWALPWLYSQLEAGPAKVPAMASEVMDVLEMWTDVEDSIAALGDAERAELIGGAEGVWAKFPGFDGNGEHRERSTALFLIKTGRWERFAGRELNSHMPVRAIYGRMLDAYRPIKARVLEGGAWGPLSADQIRSILREVVWPGDREPDGEGGWKKRSVD